MEVPDDAVVVEPTDRPGLVDQGRCGLAGALAAPVSGPPLAELVGAGDRVAVVFPDITRPMPNRTVLPPLLGRPRAARGRAPSAWCCCAPRAPTGAATDEEMAELVGREIAGRYRIHQHRADDPSHVVVGRVDGVDVALDARYVEAEVRICTGFVEPHFFAGFSGGPKGVCPGLAAADTILEAHSPTASPTPGHLAAHRRGTRCTTSCGPPPTCARPTLSVDVTLNSRHELTGGLRRPAARRPPGRLAGWSSGRRCRGVGGRFDVVVTTGGGHPLDRNLYQAVKGMAAAERVVADGGTVLLAAACGDGVPADGAFARLLAGAATPGDLARPGRTARRRTAGRPR